MSSVEENVQIWNELYDWKNSGDEWSEEWGGTDMEWYFTILPRIHRFVPAGTILEIGSGFGRWTKFLAGLCKKLLLVDLSEKCIQACRDRLRGHPDVSYCVNDGRSLAMIPDGSVDFVFSFDSLVHAEEDVIESYLHQLAAKMKPDGAGFIHHSNIGNYSVYFSLTRTMQRSRMGKLMSRFGLIESDDHARAFSMTAEKFRRFAGEAGMRCVSQEIINWGTNRLIDCMTVFTGIGSAGPREPRIEKNGNFMREACAIRRLSALYGNKPAD